MQFSLRNDGQNLQTDSRWSNSAMQRLRIATTLYVLINFAEN